MIARYSLPKMTHIWSDENKTHQMLQVELAICKAWNHEGKITNKDLSTILEKAKFQLDRIQEIEATTHHDVIAFVTNVAENIGPEGRFVHMGATSSDILDTGLALQLRESVDCLLDDLQNFASICKKKAMETKDILTIGRTHGIHAEPTSFGLKFALWYAITLQNIHRLQKVRTEVVQAKLSGAVGNFINTNPTIEEFVLKELDLVAAPVATQIVQRDIHAHYVSTLALIGSCFEQFATEIRHLQRSEVAEVQEPFGKGQKGSSAMPHKKNPILSERVCGIARLLRGYAITAFENIALWHERDISHSSAERVILPDSSIALDYAIHKFSYVVDGLILHRDQIEKNLWLTHGVYASQKVLTLLIEKGFSREDAYALVQKLSFQAFQDKVSFKDILQKSSDIQPYITSSEIDSMFSSHQYLKNVNYIYERTGIDV
ncbi:MAG: adenylosuccinate lyase [Caldisericia bacterium]|nr:adenylosuccinate lyase [Caldisericia bacterium]MDD4614376.1 adenylosuccinate lyase [Caldisericia bacterium]